MGWAGQKYTEIRFVIEDELTHVYFGIEAMGDCPLGVQGWHYKAFPPSIPIAELINRIFASGDDPVLWPQKAP